MELVFLGTGSMIPTRDRNHIAILLSYKSENLLIDCGEGTQRQFRLANISPTKVTKLLITHWHGDHVLGIPGLIQSLGASEYVKTLEIYGPKGSKEYFYHMMRGFSCKTLINIKITEIKPGVFFENKDFILKAERLEHPANCLGYSFIEKDKRNINLEYLKKFNLKQHPILRNLQEGKDIVWQGKKIKARLATKIKKGKKISFILDTNVCDNIAKLAKDSDVMVCEATHLHELKEKTEKYKHLTAKQAASLSKKANAKKLILMHFSQRYKDLRPLEKEAKNVFKNTIIARDLMRIKLP